MCRCVQILQEDSSLTSTAILQNLYTSAHWFFLHLKLHLTYLNVSLDFCLKPITLLRKKKKEVAMISNKQEITQQCQTQVTNIVLDISKNSTISDAIHKCITRHNIVL